MEDEKMFGDAVPLEEQPIDAALPNADVAAEEAEAPEAARQKDTQMPTETPFPTEAPPPQPVDANSLTQIEVKLESIAGTEQRLLSEVREMHKLYHSEFAGRLKAMQDELEQYRKIDKGRAYDDILAAIARIYGNNETLADEVTEPKAKKSIRYLLMDIEDLLGVYGMAKLRSEPGEKRNPRHCQILGRIPTDDLAKHDTVAKSYNAGFYIGNRTVIKEVVDIYFYEGAAASGEAGEQQMIGADDAPVTE